MGGMLGGETSERFIAGSVCSVRFLGTASGQCWRQLSKVAAEPCVLRHVVAGAVDEADPDGFFLGLKSAERLLGVVEGGLSH